MIIEQLLNIAAETEDLDTRRNILRAARNELKRKCNELLPNGNRPKNWLTPTATEKNVAQSNKIGAIKMYRDRTGQSLIEAKRAIEKYL